MIKHRLEVRGSADDGEQAESESVALLTGMRPLRLIFAVILSTLAINAAWASEHRSREVAREFQRESEPTTALRSAAGVRGYGHLLC